MSKNKTADPSSFLLSTSREYSIYVCEQRAIPKIEDGLKNGQRIALWLLRNRADKLKTSALSGLMSYERLYVHGDVSASNAIGLLAAPYKNNIPLIEGLGQFGSRASPVDGIGAPRYTEVRRAKAAELLMYRDLDLVPLEDNYDGSNKQPKYFLPLVPLVLLNGIEGVAVGWSTSILPRSLKSLVQATQDVLRDKPIKTIQPYYEKYDINVVELGQNKWEFHGRAEITDTSTIHVSELPPGTSIDAFRDRLTQMEEDGQILGFSDSSTETIDVTIKLKRGSVKDWKIADIVKFLKLYERVTERITVIDWNGSRIKTYDTAEELITQFTAWRLGWYTTRYQKMIDDAKYELTYWRVLKALFDNGFTQRLGKFADRAAVETDVMGVATKAKIPLDDKQMDRVVSLPTYRWTKNFEAEVAAKIAAISSDIKDFQKILSSPALLKEVYVAELDEVKKKLV